MSTVRRELLIGCGHSREKRVHFPDNGEWHGLVTLDINERANPDVLWDLEILCYPFDDGEFSEIHAYDVLEHMGRQGDWRFFFAQWMEFHRILVPGGFFFGIVPRWDSVWAWGDPSHTRVVSLDQLQFLSQEFYKNLGDTPMSDFRDVWTGDFKIVSQDMTEDKRQIFVLQKVPHAEQ